MAPKQDSFQPMASPPARGAIAVCVIFAALATFVVASRIWARRLKGVGLGLDDAFAVASLFFYCTLVLQELLGKTLGHNRP